MISTNGFPTAITFIVRPEIFNNTRDVEILLLILLFQWNNNSFLTCILRFGDTPLTKDLNYQVQNKTTRYTLHHEIWLEWLVNLISCQYLLLNLIKIFPACIYVNNRSIRKMCKIFPKLAIKIPEWRQWRCNAVLVSFWVFFNKFHIVPWFPLMIFEKKKISTKFHLRQPVLFLFIFNIYNF